MRFPTLSPHSTETFEIDATQPLAGYVVRNAGTAWDTGFATPFRKFIQHAMAFTLGSKLVYNSKNDTAYSV